MEVVIAVGEQTQSESATLLFNPETLHFPNTEEALDKSGDLCNPRLILIGHVTPSGHQEVARKV